MSCRIFVGIESGSDRVEKSAILFDSVTMTAFGPVFYTEEDAESFLQWSMSSAVDPRSLSPVEMEAAFNAWSEWSEWASAKAHADAILAKTQRAINEAKMRGSDT